MYKKNIQFSPEQAQILRLRGLNWSQKYPTGIFLDTNQNQQYKNPRFEWLLAVGVERALEVKTTDPLQPSLEALRDWKDTNPAGWGFGFLGYDLKNELEKLTSHNPDHSQSPLLYFFEPTHLVIAQASGAISILSDKADPCLFWEELLATPALELSPILSPNFEPKARFSKSDYLNTVADIKTQIREGNVYELNFCQEYYVEQMAISQPVFLFEQLNQIAKTPFAAYFWHQGFHICCASPERFLCKTGQRLFTQPIKGTRKRGQTVAADQQILDELLASTKDRAENVMIVDLVRNDLARVGKTGTIRVEELCVPYAFPSVWQLVSSVSAELRPEKDWAEALKMCFPMGSMTGAPKIAAMEYIEQFERSRRGAYSGALGYISPENDFDFNVLIRSFVYNVNTNYLSWQVGGAIVADSEPLEEYEECLIKIRPLLQTLEKLTKKNP